MKYYKEFNKFGMIIMFLMIFPFTFLLSIIDFLTTDKKWIRCYRKNNILSKEFRLLGWAELLGDEE